MSTGAEVGGTSVGPVEIIGVAVGAPGRFVGGIVPSRVGDGRGVIDGLLTGSGVALAEIGVIVGNGVLVGGTAVAVAGTGVLVAGTGVLLGPVLSTVKLASLTYRLLCLTG